MIAMAARTTIAVCIRRRSCVFGIAIRGGLVTTQLLASPTTAADWLPRYRKFRGRREAANHVLGRSTVNHPAVPKLKPRRVTDRRIMISSSQVKV